MIKRLILFFTGMFFLSNLYSQCYFHNLFRNSNNTEVDYGLSITEIFNNKLIAVGEADDNGNGVVLTVCVNLCGDTLWQKAYDYSPAGAEKGVAILEIETNNLCIVGHAFDTLQQRREGFIMFIDTFGEVLLRKTLDAGKINEIMCDGLLLNDGIMAGGFFNETGDSNLFLIKTDLQGNIQWTKYYGIAGTSFRTMKNFVKAKDGGYIMGGTAFFSGGNSNLYLLKTDSLGKKEWSKIYPNTLDQGEVVATSDRGFVLAGTSNPSTNVYNGYVGKMDSAGNVQWEKRFAKSTEPYVVVEVLQLPDSNYLVAGSIITSSSTSPKTYIAKLSKDSGTVIWQRTYTYYGANSHDYIEKLILTTEGDILGTGYIIPPNNPLLPVNYGNDMFIIKLDSCGYLESDSIKAAFTVSIDTATKTITLINQSQHYCSTNWYFGDNGSNTDINPTHTYNADGTYTITLMLRAGNSTDVVTQQVTIGKPSAVSPLSFGEGKGVRCFPNPARDNFVIVTEGLAADRYMLYDLTGREVLSGAITGNTQTVELNGLSKGVYLLRVVSKGKFVGNGKVVKE